MSKVKDEIKRLELALNQYEEGKPLPISIADIHFIIGACSRLLDSADHWEKTYQTDINKLNEDVSKFRNKWKTARNICVKLDNQTMIHKQILREVENLKWWQKSKKLKLVLQSFYRSQKKHAKEESINAITKES